MDTVLVSMNSGGVPAPCQIRRVDGASKPDETFETSSIRLSISTGELQFNPLHGPPALVILKIGTPAILTGPLGPFQFSPAEPVAIQGS
jgi:hypothetical protein